MDAAARRVARHARRARQRGAAMIEASIVMLMIVFTWAAMATAYTNGSAKLSAQWTARASTMFYASNDCKRQMPGGSAGQEGAAGRFNTQSGSGEADSASDRAPIDGGAANARSTFFFASGSATRSRSLARWSATKSSTSWAVCNETPYNGNPLGLLQYGADLFVDLLPGPVQQVFR